MGWTTMKAEERKALLTRAERRGLTADALSSEDDLVVEGRGLTLTKGSQGLKSTVLKPKNLDELLDAIGPDKDDRAAAATSKGRTMQREQLKQLASRVRMTKGDEREQAELANVAAKAAIQGVLSRDDLKILGIEPSLEILLQQIDIRRWLFPTIIVRSGSTLTFSGSDVHSLVAYKLIVESNARIVINRVPVSIDCVHLEVQ